MEVSLSETAWWLEANQCDRVKNRGIVAVPNKAKAHPIWAIPLLVEPDHAVWGGLEKGLNVASWKASSKASRKARVDLMSLNEVILNSETLPHFLQANLNGFIRKGDEEDGWVDP